MTHTPVLSIILAAGKGTRMCSKLPKPMHRLAHRSILGHVLATVRKAGHKKIAVVIGPDMDHLAEEAHSHAANCIICVQANRLGTANAVLSAQNVLAEHTGDVFVLFADTPLLRPETLINASAMLNKGANLVVMGFETNNPKGYGRLVIDSQGNLAAIREHSEATLQEQTIRICNSGVMAFRCSNFIAMLNQIDNNNIKQEYYLTDIVEVAHRHKLSCSVLLCDEEELLGINDRVQLAVAESKFQNQARNAAMYSGATLIDPSTVWFAYDTTLGQDVIVEPNVFFGPGVNIADGTHIRANCYIEGTIIGSGSCIGPYARLRPGAKLGTDVNIGNFVEVKNTIIGDNVKANHLSYLGDGTIGSGANIGAGTIFCNYDGFNKHSTVIGEKSFIGSNTSLVAPIQIGSGAIIGSGSVITRSVPDNALAIERNRQVHKKIWANKFRTLISRKR
ncbi:MAG: bifunctional UDP-N-acetylglucosamine diphosphorylase/glucosamine-1-phosphate N-acetyltransferase GlmU [Hyphomicrobiaceae bacterium]|nr:bifunctional UDP-N-acetylglucosamine diphosphorylase/glucosamine-1-phosphate N-acetyltransferase GlmU [Hyphomicrobiaceae bacterium]